MSLPSVDMSLYSRGGSVGPSIVSIVLVVAAMAGAADAQIHGSLEKMIVELPNGCSSQDVKERPNGAETFTFGYACNDRHDIVFTVSFPASVEAKSFQQGWYDLAEPANASASVSWQWKSPASVPGGIFQGTDLRLYLGTFQGGCDVLPVLRFFIPPGTYTSAASQACALTGLGQWNSGKPGDTVPWASYWAEAGFTAYYTLMTVVFPTQVARARAIYRMESPLGPDLDVDLLGPITAIHTPPDFQVTVTNRGDQTSTGGSVKLELEVDPTTYQEFIHVSTTPPGVCTWGPVGLVGDCPLGALAPGASASFTASVLGLNEDSYDLKLSAAVTSVPSDSVPSNDTAVAWSEYIPCAEDAQEDCAIVALACLGSGSSAPPSRPAGIIATVAEGLQAIAGAARALATSPIDIRSFRRLRDEVLATSAAGSRYRALYEAHTAEVTFLVGAHPDLLAAMTDGLLLWQPHVQALVEGNGGSAVITPEQIAALTGVLDRLKALGSPELRAVIAREESSLAIPTFAGKSMDEALLRAETTRVHRHLRRQAP